MSTVLLLNASGAVPDTRAVLAPESYQYLDRVVTLIQRHALDRDNVDWPRVRARAFQLADGASEPAHTYPAVEYVIGALNNRHTLFIRPEAAQAPNPVAVELPAARLVDSRVAALTIPAFQSDEEGERSYLDAGIAAINEINAAAPCGWIVDLRGNTGGNMWPMIAVLAPLLDEGTLGFFVEADGTRIPWGLRDGQPTIDTTSMTALANTLRLNHTKPAVAVLTSQQTASAGEAALIAFRGLHRAKTFGRPTAGFATANEAFPLSDGALLILTTSLDADRTGRLYGNTPIRPDEPVPVQASPEQAITAAQTWLHAQPECHAP